MTKKTRGGRSRRRSGRDAQPFHDGQPVARATPARCDGCGFRCDSDLARSKHQQATGHRYWTLLRGVTPEPAGYATR